MAMQVEMSEYDDEVENTPSNDEQYENIHFWTPDEPGDAIAGTVVGQEQTQYGTAWVIQPDEPVDVDERDEPVTHFFVNYTALNDRLEPMVDAKVAIRYDGDEKSNKGRDYKTFTVKA